MPDPHRHPRPRRPRPAHPASPRLANRAATALAAIEAALGDLGAKPVLLDMPLFARQRAVVERLLDTAETSTARHTGPGWRRHWPAERQLTARRAMVELRMALTALDLTLAAGAKARPAGSPRPRIKQPGLPPL